MLMRCARAYGSFYSQVIMVYLHPFLHNSLFLQPKIAKKSFKINIFKFKVIQGHWCWYS